MNKLLIKVLSFLKEFRQYDCIKNDEYLNSKTLKLIIEVKEAIGKKDK